MGWDPAFPFGGTRVGRERFRNWRELPSLGNRPTSLRNWKRFPRKKARTALGDLPGPSSALHFLERVALLGLVLPGLSFLQSRRFA